MIPIKIWCRCGQKYTFDVEPVNGRVPAQVVCPVCGADGTMVANAMIAQSLAARPGASVDRAFQARPAARPGVLSPAPAIVAARTGPKRNRLQPVAIAAALVLLVGSGFAAREYFAGQRERADEIPNEAATGTAVLPSSLASQRPAPELPHDDAAGTMAAAFRVPSQTPASEHPSGAAAESAAPPSSVPSQTGAPEISGDKAAQAGSSNVTDSPLAFKTLDAQHLIPLAAGTTTYGRLLSAKPAGHLKAPPPLSKRPLFGLIQAGGDPMFFRLDESRGTGLGYDRLIVDVNRNGDLRDDQVVVADPPAKGASVAGSQQQTVFDWLLYQGGKTFQPVLSADKQTFLLEPWTGPMAELSLQPHGEFVSTLKLEWDKGSRQCVQLEPSVTNGKAYVPPGIFRLFSVGLKAKTTSGETLILAGVHTGTSRAPDASVNAVGGRTTALPCGSPLKLDLTCVASRGAVLIQAKILGVGGETYTAPTLVSPRGAQRQPPPPTFTVLSADGTQLGSGNLEYG